MARQYSCLGRIRQVWSTSSLRHLPKKAKEKILQIMRQYIITCADIRENSTIAVNMPFIRRCTLDTIY